MKKLLLIFALFSIGAVTFGVVRRQTIRLEAAHIAQSSQSAAATNLLTEMNATLHALGEEIADKKTLLQASSSYPQIRADFLNLVENPKSSQPSALWAELRREMGIGWDSSKDYVLVSKRVMGSLGFYAFSPYPIEASEVASTLLAISPDEQSRIKRVIQDLGREQLLRIERNPEPAKLSSQAGDVLAQLTIPLSTPGLEQNISNRFAAEISTVLGSERADIFLREAWLGGIQPRLPLVRQTPLTLTIRRVLVDGEQKLICDAERGKLKSSQEVRYDRFPALWFGFLFPGGWPELAQYAHFELPSDFETR